MVFIVLFVILNIFGEVFLSSAIGVSTLSGLSGASGVLVPSLSLADLSALYSSLSGDSLSLVVGSASLLSIRFLRLLLV